jgi:hypothetical protein
MTIFGNRGRDSCPSGSHLRHVGKRPQYSHLGRSSRFPKADAPATLVSDTHIDVADHREGHLQTGQSIWDAMVSPISFRSSIEVLSEYRWRAVTSLDACDTTMI